MRHEIVIVLEYGGDSHSDPFTAVVGMRLPRIPRMGENLSFEGRLDGIWPTTLTFGVVGLVDAYGFGPSFEEYLRRTEIEAHCAADITPEQLTEILSAYPITEWFDHGDGRGKQPVHRERPV